MKKKKLIGFSYALNGIKSAFSTERNLKIHGCAAVIVLIFAYIFRFSRQEYLVLILTIGLVMVAELVNTAIEATVDLVCNEILKEQLKLDGYSEKAKLAKDVGAGAVLLATVASCVIGAMLFLPKILGGIL